MAKETQIKSGTNSRINSFLDSKEMLKNPIQVFERYRKTLGPTFIFYFGGMKRTIVSSDPEFIKYVLKDNHSNYNKSYMSVKRMAEFQGTGLLNSHGDYWLKQRKYLSMGFSRSRLSEQLPLQLKVLNQFMNNFDKEVSSGSVEIRNQMVKFTLRTVGKSLFGNSMTDEELNKLGDTISSIQAFIVRQIVQPYKIPWFRISGQSKRYQNMRVEADQIVKNYVHQRRLEGSSECDFLQQIIDTPYKGTDDYMTDNQIIIEMLQLLVAGNETSSNTLSWTFYLLAEHPEHLDSMRKEIETIFPTGEINYSGLHKLSYTMSVLNEAMRIYPPFWMIDRVALKDDEVCGVNIPAGTTVVPYIYGLHHNDTIWKDPNTFDPSRFNKLKSEKIHPFSHIPFGGGPRTCIGQNMAVMQMLLIISSIVRKYNFKLDENQSIEIQPMMILRPNGPINMTFEPIDQTHIN